MGREDKNDKNSNLQRDESVVVMMPATELNFLLKWISINIFRYSDETLKANRAWEELLCSYKDKKAEHLERDENVFIVITFLYMVFSVSCSILFCLNEQVAPLLGKMLGIAIEDIPKKLISACLISGIITIITVLLYTFVNRTQSSDERPSVVWKDVVTEYLDKLYENDTNKSNMINIQNVKPETRMNEFISFMAINYCPNWKWKVLKNILMLAVTILCVLCVPTLVCYIEGDSKSFWEALAVGKSSLTINAFIQLLLIAAANIFFGVLAGLAYELCYLKTRVRFKTMCNSIMNGLYR